jgi:signal transduction histidine kinase/ligand-binding sensor domain-containing protein
MAIPTPRIWPSLLAVACGLLVAPAGAQTSEWLARAWQLDEGLPGNSVTGIAQTPDGYLWVATEGGLARFDGANFKDIPVPIPSGRTRPIIRAMLLGQDHQIWLALEGGNVIALSGQTSTLFTKANGLSGVRCENMVQDGDNSVWTSHSDGAVCRIAHGQVTRFFDSSVSAGDGPCFLARDNRGQVWFARENHVGIIRDGAFPSLLQPSARVIRLGSARSGGIWACAGLQLLHCNESGQSVNCGTLPVDRPGVEPTAVFEDRTGAVWIGTSVDGLYRYDGMHFARVETSHEMILSLGEDNEGNVWAGTGGGGLDRLRPRVVEVQTGESGLPSATIRSICEGDAGTMWAVAENGGLARRTRGAWKTMGSEDGWSGARTTCVVSDRQGGVWVGTSHGGLQRWDDGRFRVLGRENGLGGDVIRGLLVDHTGDLWIALDSPACLQRLHQDQFQTFTQSAKGAIRALVEDTKGTLWCGTQDGLLFRLDGHELKNETPHTSSPSAPIRCMQAMPDGSVWIGYAGAGLGIRHDGKFAQITEEQGLFDSYISSMGADDHGGFWCASDRGIFQVPVGEIEAVADGRAARVHSIHLGRDDGLQNLQGAFGYAPGAAKSQDGRLWFPMRSGLAVVNPLRLAASRAPLPVLIERVAVDGRPVSMNADGRWVLPSAHQRLEINFTAPTFIAAEDVRFRYRLKGWDSNWNEGGAHRSATYSRLPAGNYTFGVIAGNQAGVWSDRETTAMLTVPPFLWDRWPVRATGLVLFTLGVIAAARYVGQRRLLRRLARLEQETSLHRERSRIAQDLHDDIGASLTHIALLSELAQKDFNNPDQARDHIDRIFRRAQTMVRSLDEIVWTVNPKNDTMDVFVTYLCTYSPDYLRSAGIRCRLDVPVDVPAVQLSSQVGHQLPLAVKETLHNIVKHAGATEVWLRLRFASEEITLTIEDNGRGFQRESLPALDADGLGNLSLRLGSIGGLCQQRSEPGMGTTITLTVPLKKQGTRTWL